MLGLILRRRHTAALAESGEILARLRADLDEARQECAAFKAAAESAAQHYVTADKARVAETRRADQLQQRLDQALGLDSIAVHDGARWQQRRADKPKEVQP